MNTVIFTPLTIAPPSCSCTLPKVNTGELLRRWSNDVVQPVVAAQPARTTVSFGAGGNDSAMPAVEFDGVGTFLAGDMVLPPEKTIMVVLVVGSKADVCCSGVAIVWSAGVLT